MSDKSQIDQAIEDYQQVMIDLAEPTDSDPNKKTEALKKAEELLKNPYLKAAAKQALSAKIGVSNSYVPDVPVNAIEAVNDLVDEAQALKDDSTPKDP